MGKPKYKEASPLYQSAISNLGAVLRETKLENDITRLRELLRECQSDYATAWQVIQETLDNNAIRPEDKDRLIKLRNALYVLKHKLAAALGEK